MHYFTRTRQADALNNLVFPVDRQLLFLFVEKRINEIQNIARV